MSKVIKICLIACLFWLLFYFPLLTIAPIQATSVTPPKTSQVGIYLTSLQDFNAAENSFSATFWIWSVSPLETPNILESMDLVNGKEVSINYSRVSQSENLSDIFKANKNLFWAEEEISGTFYHNWDTTNYPFDRHVLKIILEETQLDASKFVHTPDFANTGYRENINLEGWEISDFKISQVNFPYKTSFGNPAITTELNERSRLVISITINRKSKVSFFKLSMGVYVAVAMSIMTLLLSRDFSDQMGIFVGTLFAVLVNMQVATLDLGSSNSVTLVDFIHIIAIIYIFISAFMVVYTHFLTESTSEESSQLLIRRFVVPIMSISFIVINIIIISYAAIVG